jgi:hypothetical protein
LSRMNLPPSLLSQLRTEGDLEAVMNEAAVIQASDAAVVQAMAAVMNEATVMQAIVAEVVTAMAAVMNEATVIQASVAV